MENKINELVERLSKLVRTRDSLIKERESLDKVDPLHGFHIQVGGRPSVQFPRSHELHDDILHQIQHTFDMAIKDLTDSIENFH